MKRCPVPQNKADVAIAKSLLGYEGPVSGKDYKKLIVWLKNERWPVFPFVATFLASRGAEVGEAIEQVIKSKDGVWKRNIVKHLMTKWSVEDVQKFQYYLLHFVSDCDLFGPDLDAVELLLVHQLVAPDWLAQWLEFKKKNLIQKLQTVESLLEQVNTPNN